jgi:hypothetical protein
MDQENKRNSRKQGKGARDKNRGREGEKTDALKANLKKMRQ